MGQIHQLSSVLSNQIAAGEVVERPASVVKELVENSIDANSKEIDVIVDSAGFDRIKVIDDGQGIEKDDVKTAFLRHATSKITSRMDLFKVNSLGFRGEALPSIASVSDIDLKTSTGDEGTEIHIKGGKLLFERPAEARRGTSVSVSNLFYNTPARLKYMKSPATELSKISDIIDRLALGHPEIAFSLIHNNRELLRTSGRNNLQQVIGSIYGNPKVKKMLPIEGHDLDFKVDGYISLPELTRASHNYISIIVNGRFVRNKELAQAIVAGYGSKLMVGRYPIAVINIQMDSMLVDANVHPTKQMIRISKEDELCDLLTKLVSKNLGKQNLIPNAIERQGAVKPRYLSDDLDLSWDKVDKTKNNKESTKTGVVNVQPKNSEPLAKADLNLPPDIIIKSKRDLNQPAVSEFKEYYENEVDQLPFGEDDSNRVAPSSERTNFPNLLYIGQMHGSYLIAEANDGMYIVDQHAAQERINYERFRQAIGEVSSDQQNLLVPIVLEYSNADFIQIEDRLDVLRGIGIDLEPFGKNSFIIHHHPSWFKKGEEERNIRELVDEVLKNRKISLAEFRAKTAIMMSCKRAIKANHYLDRHQAETLLANLKKTEDPFNCPHGRPVLVHFSNYDMKKMFRRVQESHTSLRNEQKE